ncbi:recombinase family protein [Chloroflexota bacterium]
MNNQPYSIGEKVAGYFRDSGGDEQDLSVDRQVAEFRRWLDENNLREGKLFIDSARPGSNVIGRAGFQEMIKYFRSGKAEEKGLAVWRSNRFGRNTNDNQFYKADIRRRGYIIHSLTDNIPADQYGQIIEYLLDWKDQEFLRTLSEDVSSGLRHIVETYGAMPGTPPRGFMREKITVGKRRNGQDHVLAKWVPDPAIVPLVRRAFKMLVEGESLARIQTVTGLYNSLNSFVTFFRNPLYKGVLKYKDIIKVDYCEPVVDQDIWDKAQQILNGRAGRRNIKDSDKNPLAHPRRVSSSWLLSGILRCARCGSPMNGHSIKAHSYYRCSRSIRRRDCDAINVPAESLEVEVIKQIQRMVREPETLTQAQTDRIQKYNQSMEEFPKRQKELSSRLEKLRRQITRIADAIAEHGHSAALLEKLKGLEKQEYELNDELAQIEQVLQSKPEAIGVERIRRLADHFDKILSSGSQEEQRRAIAGWIHHLEVERVDKKSVLVGMGLFVPPKVGGGTPGGNSGQGIEPLWGHNSNRSIMLINFCQC